MGRPAPAFRLTGLNGAEVASSDYAGRVYVVNFWALWCVPCRREAPHLQRFWEEHGPDGVGLVGVVYQDRQDKAQAFRDEFALTYPQVMHPSGTTAQDFGLVGIPETFVVDERGVVMAEMLGAIGPDTLDEALSRVGDGHMYARPADDQAG